MATQTVRNKMSYTIQVDDEVRNATVEEIEFLNIQKEFSLQLNEAEIAKTKAKAELLERLGITEDEAKLLLA